MLKKPKICENIVIWIGNFTLTLMFILILGSYLNILKMNEKTCVSERNVPRAGISIYDIDVFRKTKVLLSLNISIHKITTFCIIFSTQ